MNNDFLNKKNQKNQKETRTIKRDKFHEALIEEIHSRKDNTDWCVAADMFMHFLIDNPNSETYNDFITYLESGDGCDWELPIEVVEEDDAGIVMEREEGIFSGTTGWELFYRYYDFEEFAEDWVAEKDREGFLQLCQKATRRKK